MSYRHPDLSPNMHKCRTTSSEQRKEKCAYPHFSTGPSRNHTQTSPWKKNQTKTRKRKNEKSHARRKPTSRLFINRAFIVDSPNPFATFQRLLLLLFHHITAVSVRPLALGSRLTLLAGLKLVDKRLPVFHPLGIFPGNAGNRQTNPLD
jgi:hypothetical protein